MHLQRGEINHIGCRPIDQPGKGCSRAFRSSHSVGIKDCLALRYRTNEECVILISLGMFYADGPVDCLCLSKSARPSARILSSTPKLRLLPVDRACVWRHQSQPTILDALKLSLVSVLPFGGSITTTPPHHADASALICPLPSPLIDQPSRTRGLSKTR